MAIQPNAPVPHSRFNTPPGWPAPPAGWTPPTGWKPDPSWPPVPQGWQLWSASDVSAEAASHVVPSQVTSGTPPALYAGADNPLVPPSRYGWIFNPAPGWPRQVRKWQPSPEWRPDSSWPAAPQGWQFWLLKRTPLTIAERSPFDRTRIRWGGGATIGLGIVLLFQGAAGIFFGALLILLGIATWWLTSFGSVLFVTLSPGQQSIVGTGSMIGNLFLYSFFFCFFATMWMINAFS
jgi:hypothetical protein